MAEMANMTEMEWGWYIHLLNRHLTNPGPGGEPNLCDVIASTRGWLPLEVKETMTVHYDDKEYIIKRNR